MESRLESLQLSLAAVQRLLEHFDNRGVVIGGIAASILGKPRLTFDIDVVLLLSVDDLADLIKIAGEEGFDPRIADAQAFAHRHRVLLLRHRESGMNVDISLGILPFEVEAVERGIEYDVGGITLLLPTPEDLVIMKAVAHRPKDLLDIQGVVEMHPGLDRERVEYWVREFAWALEKPELWDDVERLLAQG